MHIGSFRLKTAASSPGPAYPGEKASIDRAKKAREVTRPLSSETYDERAILTKVCRCKPTRRSCKYPELKYGRKLLKVNYFRFGCTGVGFFDGRRRARYVTETVFGWSEPDWLSMRPSPLRVSGGDATEIRQKREAG
jgi:hypothetical protein